MALQLSITWESVPIPTETILRNSPIVVGVLTYAYALIYSDPTTRQFDVLTQKVAAWSGQPADAVERVLREGLGIAARPRLLEEISVPASTVRSRSVKDKPAVEKKPEYKTFVTESWLNSLPSQFPLVNTRRQYTLATAWYLEKGRSLTQAGFLRWLERCAPDKQAAASAACPVCDNTQSVLQVVDGIPTTQDCPACVRGELV